MRNPLRTAAAVLALTATSPFPAPAAEASLSSAAEALLPLVRVQDDGGYERLGNAVLIDRDGHLVAPAHTVTGLPATAFLPSLRLGVLVADGPGEPGGDVSADRRFTPTRLLALEPEADLALLRLEGDAGRARPALTARETGLGDRLQVMGYGGPGIRAFLFPVTVSGFLPAPSRGPEARRLALHGPVTEAAAGGILFDRSTGRLHGLAVFHLRNVHRVVVKQEDFEFGPTGTAFAVPAEEILAWVRATREELDATAVPLEEPEDPPEE